MKVKKYYPEYDEWKTEAQWKKLGYEVIDKSKYEEMWPTQSHCQYRTKFFKYYGPDNVKLVKPIPEAEPVQKEFSLSMKIKPNPLWKRQQETGIPRRVHLSFLCNL